MFDQILVIMPQVDPSALAKAERTMNTRFSKIAKRFGDGLKAALTGGGITGLALGLIDKILNPLKETQEAIDKVLSRSNDLKTLAEQFNTTTGNVFRIQQLAKAKGVDDQTLQMLIQKFQVAVAEAIADPTKDTSVRNFAVKGQDTAEAFFQFIQSMQKLSKDDQVRVQQDIFGERVVGRALEFFNEKDFGKLASALNLKSSSVYTPLIEKGSKANDIEEILSTGRDSDYFLQGLQKIRPSMLEKRDVDERERNQRELNKFDFYGSMVQMDLNVQKITAQLEQLTLNVGKGVTSLAGLQNVLLKIPGAKLMRGILNSTSDDGK